MKCRKQNKVGVGRHKPKRQWGGYGNLSSCSDGGVQDKSIDSKGAVTLMQGK